MIIISVTGGLGNQLFQYAMGRRLAVQHKTDLLLDLRNYGAAGEGRPKELSAFARPLTLLKFRIKARVATEGEIATVRDQFQKPTTIARSVRLVRKFKKDFLWKST